MGHYNKNGDIYFIHPEPYICVGSEEKSVTVCMCDVCSFKGENLDLWDDRG